MALIVARKKRQLPLLSSYGEAASCVSHGHRIDWLLAMRGGNMYRARVDWREYRRDSYRTDEADLYMYVFKRPLPGANGHRWKMTLLYIGMSYHQTVDERMSQEHAAYDCIERFRARAGIGRLIRKVGVITVEKDKKLTKDVVKAIEQALIIHNQPKCNTAGARSYAGRDISVLNTGNYAPLERKTAINDAFFDGQL